MLVSCWSAKGGSGTTTVAAGLAMVLAEREPRGVLVVDLAGDLPALLGVAEPPGPGISDWLAAGADVPADALARLEIPLGRGIHLIPRGSGEPTDLERVEVLAALLAGDPRPVVVDAGQIGPVGVETGEQIVRRVMAATATHSLLVIRPCFLALRRASAVALRPAGVVLVNEEGRGYGRHAVETILGAPVVAEVPFDAAVGRAIDSGRFRAKLPRTFERALRHAA